MGVDAAFVYVALTNSALGLTSTDARLTIGGAFVTGIILYISDARVPPQPGGIDTSLAYRYVPPD